MISILELDNRIPVSPPSVKRKINPLAQSIETELEIEAPEP